MIWRLRAFLFATLFYAGTAVFVLSGIGTSPFSHRATREVAHVWTRFHAWLARNLLDIRTELIGKIPDFPCLIAVKHQAMFETLEVVRIGRRPVIVMKKELSEIPLFGFMTRQYGSIAVERTAGAKALRSMMKEGRAAIAGGRSVLIFPEGTRVRPGEMPPLRPGFAGLYRVLGLPVVPIALDSGRRWIGWRALGPGPVKMVVGETLPPGLGREEIEALVHRGINALEVATT